MRPRTPPRGPPPAVAAPAAPVGVACSPRRAHSQCSRRARCPPAGYHSDAAAESARTRVQPLISPAALSADPSIASGIWLFLPPDSGRPPDPSRTTRPASTTFGGTSPKAWPSLLQSWVKTVICNVKFQIMRSVLSVVLSLLLIVFLLIYLRVYYTKFEKLLLFRGKY